MQKFTKVILIYYSIVAFPTCPGIAGNQGSNPTITNCTFTGHGNVVVYGWSNSDPVIKNCIFWNPAAAGELSSYLADGSTTIVSYSVIEGGLCPAAQGCIDGGGNLSTDPVLGTLQDNGGPVQTIAIGAAGSAYDAGTLTGAPATDARGLARDTLPDIGAYEIVLYSVTPSVSGGNGSIAPNIAQDVPAFSTTQFDLTPSTGYHADLVTGTCGGTLSGDTFTTDPITAPCTVIASFAINTYTLTYTAGLNGLLTGTTSQIVEHGSDGTAVTAVPGTGYHFVQWDDSITDNPRTDTGVTGDIDVTATFAINTYTLTYTAGLNGSISGTTPQTVTYGSDGTAVTAVPETGYHFVQWDDGVTDNPRTDTGVTGDIDVTAAFAINTYTVNSSVSGGNGTINPSGDQIVDHGATPSFTLVPVSGFHAEQVIGTCGGTLIGNTFTADAVTGNCTVIAIFSDTYTVTSSVLGGNGTIDPLGGQTVSAGATPSFILTPDTGYHIDAVTGTCGGNLSANTFTVDAISISCTVIANFAINTYTVSSSVLGGNGTIDPSGDQKVDHGATPSFSLFPVKGFHVDEVTGTCGGILAGNTFTANAVTAPCTVVAGFSDTYTLQLFITGPGSGTVTSSPAGINCSDDCSADFTDGQEVTLTAVADDKNKFGGWSGSGCTGTGECTVTMDQAREVSAAFKSSFSWNLFLPAIISGSDR